MSNTQTLDRAAQAMALVDYRDAANLKQLPTRNGFGEGLLEAAQANRNVIGICADLSESTRFEALKNALPEQYLEIGADADDVAVRLGRLEQPLAEAVARRQLFEVCGIAIIDERHGLRGAIERLRVRHARVSSPA